MPGRPRKHVIRKDEIGVFHVWSRCVRQCWLCGVDPQTGQDYSHRKQWIHQRMEDFARIFAIDACVYAILSNHYHLIVRNRIDLAQQWTAEEVAPLVAALSRAARRVRRTGGADRAGNPQHGLRSPAGGGLAGPAGGHLLVDEGDERVDRPPGQCRRPGFRPLLARTLRAQLT